MEEKHEFSPESPEEETTLPLGPAYFDGDVTPPAQDPGFPPAGDLPEETTAVLSPSADSLPEETTMVLSAPGRDLPPEEETTDILLTAVTELPADLIAWDESEWAVPAAPQSPAVTSDTVSYAPLQHGPAYEEGILSNLIEQEVAGYPQEESFRDDEFRDTFGDGQEFEAMFTSEPTEEEPPMPQTKKKAPRKGRPKRKKGDGLLGIPHILTTFVWLAIIVAIGVSLGRMLWLCAADVLAFGREDRPVTVTIESADTVDTIADKLYNAGLIRYPGLFKLYAGLAVDEGEISTGTFTLNAMYDYHALVNGMHSTSSYRTVIEDVLIPEGYNCRQIFQLLEEEGICTVAELEAYAATGEFSDFWFLEGVERGDKYCLEGYLFPDTYDFYEGSTPREALGKMLTGFENRVTEEYTSQLAALNETISQMMRSDGRSEDYIAAHQLTFRDVVIVASLIEEETGDELESYNIASVIYNRLYRWGSTPSYLNIDAAIIYVTGDPDNIDTSLDSPYNTYKNIGLTPGPISNPGLASLKAALNPADTGYYFYVLNPATGDHTFTSTREEHEKLVEQYAAAAAAAASEE